MIEKTTIIVHLPIPVMISSHWLTSDDYQNAHDFMIEAYRHAWHILSLVIIKQKWKDTNLVVLDGFQVDKFHLFWAGEILDCPKLS